MYTSEDNVLMGVYAYQKIECKTAVISRMLSSHGVVETIFCSVTHVWYLSFLYLQLLYTYKLGQTECNAYARLFK